MGKIKWIKDCGVGKFSSYYVKIGPFHLVCKPEVKYPWSIETKRYVAGWKGSIYFAGRWIVTTKLRKSIELAQKNTEKLVAEYMFGLSHIVFDGFRKMGLSEEMLSEFGIDL